MLPACGLQIGQIGATLPAEFFPFGYNRPASRAKERHTRATLPTKVIICADNSPTRRAIIAQARRAFQAYIDKIRVLVTTRVANSHNDILLTEYFSEFPFFGRVGSCPHAQKNIDSQETISLIEKDELLLISDADQADQIVDI